MFRRRYADVFRGDADWQALPLPRGETYAWDPDSTYIRNPPYFERTPQPGADAIRGARVLAVLGDSVTTDHISPAGSIAPGSPAAQYLQAHGVARADFNSYGSRRGNHEVMMRGTFANPRLRNELAPGTEGGVTRIAPGGEPLPIHDAAMHHAALGTPLFLVAGKEYGTGSSRDWAAKGTFLLGVRAVIAESFERIHRSNLVGMGVLPLTFKPGTDRKTLGLDGSETIDVTGIAAGLKPRIDLTLKITKKDGTTQEVPVLCRVDTLDELDYYRHGGILQYVLRSLLN
jgi:aconitate hydratase